MCYIYCFISFSTIGADSFTAKLFNIYETVYKEGFNQVKQNYNINIINVHLFYDK